MRPKPKNASEHHGAFGRMRLRYEGLLERGNGARHHRFEFRHLCDRWPRTALGKLRTHLAAAGYEPGDTTERLDNAGVVWDRTYVFRRGVDEVRVSAYGTGPHNPEERVHRVDHYPDGTAGDGRNRLTIGDVINAMSWGMARA
jgi:hypothetical protein